MPNENRGSRIDHDRLFKELHQNFFEKSKSQRGGESHGIDDFL